MTPTASDGADLDRGEMRAERRHTWSRGVTKVAVILWAVIGVVLLFEVGGASLALGDGELLGHFFLFFLPALGLTSLLLDRLSLTRALGLSVVGFVILAALTEASQALLDRGRNPEWDDLAADVMGVLVANVVMAVIARAKRSGSAVASWSISLLLLASSVGLTSVVVWSTPGVAVWRNCRSENSFESADAPIVFSDQSRTLDENLRRAFYCEVMRTNAFTVVARLSTSDLTQTGPTRIVTSSVGTRTDQFNFHLAQEGDGASIRIRLSGSNNTFRLVDGVFVTTSPITLTLTYDNGRVSLRRDGELLDEFDAAGAASTTFWDLEYPLIVGDEFTEDRTFLGSIERVELYPFAR